MWVSPALSLQVPSTFPDQFHADGDLSLDTVEVIRARKWRWHCKKGRERTECSGPAELSSTKVTTLPSIVYCYLVMGCNEWAFYWIVLDNGIFW